MGTPTLFLLFVASSAFAVCPNGTVFESQFNKCYQYVSQTTSFPLAEKNCEHMGGTLLSILNSFENSYVSLIASQYASSNQTFWIGINSIYYTNWTWINKDPSTYRNWAADQPNNSVQCGSMQLGNNQWSTTICNYAMPYMCQIRANITGSCPAGHCSDPGYVLNPDSCKCYKYIGWTFYNESEALCAGEDATLPIILNANDNEFLEHLVRAYNHPWVWLGLQCPSTLTTSCTWQDGTPLQGFTNFTSGYPHANEYAYMQTTDGSWNTNSGRDNGINCVCQKMEYPKRLLSWLLLKKKQIELDTISLLEMGAAALLLALFVSSALATCPDGTIFDARFNKCYKFITQPASFLLAEKTCESIGGSLVTVSNAFENTFISGIAAYNESTIQFWIGMNLLYYDQWTWVNGDSSSFRHWASGQPTSGPQGGAIQVVDTLWTTAQYNTILPYMCQIDPNAAPGNSCTTPSVPLTTALPATAAPGPCPNGHCPDANYTLNPDNCQCYKYTHYYGSYNESVQICSNDSATLPIIRSQSEDNFVGQFMNGWSNYIWLGLQCTSNSTANCRWQDGSPLQGYNHFYPNNPNGSPPVMKETVNNGFWFSEPFSDTNGCLCQKNGIP